MHRGTLTIINRFKLCRSTLLNQLLGIVAPVVYGPDHTLNRGRHNVSMARHFRLPENLSAGVASAGCDASPGSDSARQTDGKHRARVVGEIGRTGRTAMELGDQPDDVEAEPEVRP